MTHPPRSSYLAAAVVLFAAGCGGGAPGPAIASAAPIGVVDASSWIVGRDGGESVLAWGHAVFTYGDTVLGQADAAGSTWHHNSYAVTSDLDAADGIGGFSSRVDSAGAPSYLIAPTPDEQAFNDAHAGDPCAETPCGARWAVWPGRPVFDATKSRAILPYGLIYAEPGSFNFHGVGQSFASWTSLDAAPVRPVVDASAEHPDLVFGEGEPGWGISPILQGEDLFMFACEGDGLSKPCSLARVPIDDVLDRSAYRYFDGRAWSDRAEDAAAVFDGAPILSVSYNAHLGAWLAVYSPPFDQRIVARTAPELTGPWSSEATLYVAPGENAPYDALHHPEYEEDGGRIEYVTYSRPTTGLFGSEFALVKIVLR